jgi:hypothetical protein
MNAIVRMLAVYAGLALLLCAMTNMEWSPLRANGFGQWAALFLLIFPAAAAADFLGERLFGKRAVIEPRQASGHVDCPWFRLVAAVLVVSVTIGAVMVAAWWLSHPAAALA